MKFGIDIGTTSVSGVAVDDRGQVLASANRAHEADLPTNADGVFEQDPEKLMAATDAVIAELEAAVGKADRIGWTGQMHGVVGVDESLQPVTPFVTWRDRRLYGGRVMKGWQAEGRRIFKCLSVCGLAIARREKTCVIDPTFLHAWYLDDACGDPSWIPPCEADSMLGDNQAGVRAAQAILPGCAVVNLGTSGQLSVVRDEPFAGRCVPGAAATNGLRTELRPYPGGRTLVCRAAIAGGRAWADLRERLGLSWDEMNATDDPQVKACAAAIVEELVGGIDLSHVSGVIGTGNGLVRNPALKAAVEKRFGCVCQIPAIAEMAAYGVAT